MILFLKEISEKVQVQQGRELSRECRLRVFVFYLNSGRKCLKRSAARIEEKQSFNKFKLIVYIFPVY